MTGDRRQATGTSTEDMVTADERGYEWGRGHCGYGPRSHGVEEDPL